MPYKIAGIDVHKKMLAVAVADVEDKDEYQVDCSGNFGSVHVLDVPARPPKLQSHLFIGSCES